MLYCGARTFTGSSLARIANTDSWLSFDRARRPWATRALVAGVDQAPDAAAFGLTDIGAGIVTIHPITAFTVGDDIIVYHHIFKRFVHKGPFHVIIGHVNREGHGIDNRFVPDHLINHGIQGGIDALNDFFKSAVKGVSITAGLPLALNSGQCQHRCFIDQGPDRFYGPFKCR